jgi:hypothetical protein
MSIRSKIQKDGFVILKNIFTESEINNYHTNETRKQNSDNDYKLWLKNIGKGTLTLKHLLKEKYNCNVLSINPFINYQLEGNKYDI